MERTSNSHDDTKDAVPEAERRPILLRAYAETELRRNAKPKAPNSPQFVLVFDTETTPDESQQLRFGTYQLLKKGKLIEKGLFYGKVEPAELETLKAEAPKHGCVEPLSVFDFIHKRFLPTAFKAGGLVVGFNLPFDLSRLAIRHEAARVSRSPRTPEEIAAGAPLKDADRSMVGGFTFQLSPVRRPTVPPHQASSTAAQRSSGLQSPHNKRRRAASVVGASGFSSSAATFST